MKRNSGFTLIELLIVIVIIGILAAVLIQIISPGKQQNQANDGVITSMMNKIILSTESFNSAYGRVPKDAEFFSSLEFTANEAWATVCTSATDSECILSISGVNPPALCDATGWTDLGAGGTSQCYFRYIGGIFADPSRFRLYVHSAGIADKLFVFDNKSGGKVFQCPLTMGDADSVLTECQ